MLIKKWDDGLRTYQLCIYTYMKIYENKNI